MEVPGRDSSSSDAKSFKGVRVVGRVIEIKHWFGRGKHFYKTVGMSAQEAAVAHDLARVHMNPAVDVKLLNITALGYDLQNEDPVMARNGRPLNIDKEFYTKFVEDHPLMQSEREAIQEEILKQAPVAFQCLKTEIKRFHSSRAGRLLREVDELLPQLQEGNPLEISIEEIKQLNFTKDAEIAVLKKACEEKDAEITALKNACEEKDAEITAKHAGMNKLKEELYAANEQAKIVTPYKSGFAMRENLYLHNDANPAPGDGIQHLELSAASDEWMYYFQCLASEL